MATSNVFYIECAHAVEDSFIQLKDFHQYLIEHMKVNNLKNNLANKVTIEMDEAGKKIAVTANVKYSKRACRYYARKYLAKQNIRDRFRLVATSKNSYELRPYGVTNE